MVICALIEYHNKHTREPDSNFVKKLIDSNEYFNEQTCWVFSKPCISIFTFIINTFIVIDKLQQK
jgi:hypothetical protein